MSVERPPLYQEALRPQFHFTARYWTDYRLNPDKHQEGWINDVNGLVYLNGEYHFFAQRWWSCWLHAVSTDLIHWEELPPAFGKDESGGTQSGGAVVDYENCSGLATGSAPVMIAFWSGTDNVSQCISYSNDYGRSWVKYAKNPVLSHPHRDPKVFWYAPEKKWIMVLYGPPDRSYLFFSSTNLLDWTKIGAPLPDMYECPDMFELPVDGDTRRKKWVIVNGNGCYVTGEFDGTHFTAETPKARGDFGRNFYATMTWNGMPKDDPRRIQLAWMKGGTYPDMPFNQQITFPCELTLRALPEGLRLCRYPVREIELLRSGSPVLRDGAVGPGDDPLREVDGDLFDIDIEIDAAKSTCSALTLDAGGCSVSYDFAKHVVTSCSISTDLPPRSGKVRLRVLIDRMSVETFGNRGEVSLTNVAQPEAGAPLSLKSTGGSSVITSLVVHRLKSIWTK